MTQAPPGRIPWKQEILDFIKFFHADQQRYPTFQEIRRYLGMAQRDMATACGVCLRTYHTWETGKGAARIDKRRQFMSFIEVPFYRHREIFGLEPLLRTLQSRGVAGVAETARV